MFVSFRARETDGGQLNTYTAEISAGGVASIRVDPVPNNAPTADAGPDQPTVTSAATVTLDGSASNANDAGQTLTYAWTQTGGTAVALSDATVSNPSFTAPTLVAGAADETLTFSLVVNDGIEASPADTVTITVAASDTPTSADTTTAAAPGIAVTQREIASFVQGHAAQVINAQPNLTGLLSGDLRGRANTQVTRSAANFDVATGETRLGWAQLQGTRSSSGDIDNSYVFGVAGAHFKLGENAIIGGMIQFDRASQENGDSEITGTGFLAGPYVVAKLPDQPLFFEGRLLAGKTSNDLNVAGFATQEFDTSRNLASLKVSGELTFGATRLMPSLGVTRLSDTQDAFTDTSGKAIAEQDYTVIDTALGLDFAQPIATERGDLILTGGIAAISSSSSGSGFIETLTPEFDGGRARVHLGTQYALEIGGVLDTGVSYDGIGADDFESWSLRIGFHMDF